MDRGGRGLSLRDPIVAGHACMVVTLSEIRASFVVGPILDALDRRICEHASAFRRVGGDVVRARLAAFRGALIPTAAASVLVDITLGVFVQIGFTLLGLALIVTATGHQGFVRPMLIGAVIGVLAIIGFYIVQRLGIFRFIGKMISRLANAEDWHSLVHSGQSSGRGDSQAVCTAMRCGWMLLMDGDVTDPWIRRNLDRSLCARIARDARQCSDPSKHGSDDPLASLSCAGRTWSAGGWLRPRW